MVTTIQYTQFSTKYELLVMQSDGIRLALIAYVKVTVNVITVSGSTQRLIKRARGVLLTNAAYSPSRQLNYKRRSNECRGR